MHRLKGLIHEVYRRSLWQVLGVFIAAAWGVLEFIEFLTERAGLPDWTPTMALVFLALGLPVVLATAFVQEGMPGAERGAPSGGSQGPMASTAPERSGDGRGTAEDVGAGSAAVPEGAIGPLPRHHPTPPAFTGF